METITVADLGMLRGRRVYIAGPYRSRAGSSVVENVRLAERAAWACARAGVHFMCPHLNTQWMSGAGDHGGIAPNEFFLAMDMNWVGVSQDILMLPGWEDSPGAQGELEYAEILGLGMYEMKEI